MARLPPFSPLEVSSTDLSTLIPATRPRAAKVRLRDIHQKKVRQTRLDRTRCCPFRPLAPPSRIAAASYSRCDAFASSHAPVDTPCDDHGRVCVAVKPDCPHDQTHRPYLTLTLRCVPPLRVVDESKTPLRRTGRIRHGRQTCGCIVDVGRPRNRV